MSFAREQRSACFQAIGAGRSQAPRKATLIRPLARGLSVDSANCRGGVDLTNLDFVDLSRGQSDHMGGLSHVLSVNPKVKDLRALRKVSEFTVRRCHLAFTARTSNAVRCNVPPETAWRIGVSDMPRPWYLPRWRGLKVYANTSARRSAPELPLKVISRRLRCIRTVASCYWRGAAPLPRL